MDGLAVFHEHHRYVYETPYAGSQSPKENVSKPSPVTHFGCPLECMDDSRVEEVVLINRNPLGTSHPKVKEIIHKDFTAIKSQLGSYDACFHCMGVFLSGMSEEAYTDVTYTITKALASTLYRINPEVIHLPVKNIRQPVP